MRSLVAVIMCAGALSACDDGLTRIPPPAPGAPETANIAAMKGAAEAECAQLTGYSPAGLKTMSAEMQTLVTREYKSCVDAVTRGNRPDARPPN